MGTNSTNSSRSPPNVGYIRATRHHSSGTRWNTKRGEGRPSEAEKKREAYTTQKDESMKKHDGTTQIKRSAWMMRMITLFVVGILAAGGALVSFCVYGFFTGNPRQHMQCKNHAQAYLQKAYPFLHVAELQSGYNSKTAEYSVSVATDAPAHVRFSLHYDSTGKFLSDNYIEKKLEYDIFGEIAPVLQQTLPEIDDIHVVVYKYPDQVYEKNIVFHHELRVDCRVWVRVIADSMSRGTCATNSITIMQVIKTTGIHARYVFITCRGNDQPSQFTVIIEPENAVTHASIVEHMTEERISD